MYVLRVIDDDCGLLHHQGSVFSFEMRGPLPSMKLRRILRLPPPAARLLDAIFFSSLPNCPCPSGFWGQATWTTTGGSSQQQRMCAHAGDGDGDGAGTDRSRQARK